MLAGVVIALACHHGAQPEAIIRVEPDRRDGEPVPRAFFGQFAEHIGENVYNGQWAQILRNPGFEGVEFFHENESRFGVDMTAGRDQGLATYWLPEGEAGYSLSDDAFNSESAQRVDVASRGGVYSPIMLPLHRCLSYDLTFQVRCDAPVTGQALIRTADGTVVARATVTPPGGDGWSRVETVLDVKPGPGAGDLCHLVLAFDGPVSLFLDQAELFPADAMEGFDPDVVRLVRELRVSLVRFPGGNFVSGYHWRDGVGPRDERPTHKNPAWGGLEPNHVGTDEWMTFVRLVNAEPMICVNCGNGTAEEAADWVRYCNEPADGPLGRLRAANGHPEPYNVRYWEVGNELWGNWQIGHCSPEECAQRYDAFSRAMLAADPSILLVANGGDGDWADRFLRAATEPVRSLSCHRLIGFGVKGRAEDIAGWLAAMGLDFGRQLADMQAVCRDRGAPDCRLAVTELMSVAPRDHPPLTHCRHAEVLYFAGMMNACIRHRDFVELVTRTAIINHGGGRAKINEVAFPEPVHFLSKIYGTMSGRWPVACTVDAPTYDTTLKGVAPIRDVPVIECLALVDDEGSELTVVVTNRDPVNAHTARIEIPGATGPVTLRTRTIAGHPDTVNVWNRDPDVRIEEDSVDTQWPATHTFPACSVTEVVIPLSR